MVFPDLAPFYVPARLNRLVSQGLLDKDPANSSSRTKVYTPTEAGNKEWQEMKWAS
jgi:DNA-binding PadR family transcriptional regulator